MSTHTYQCSQCGTATTLPQTKLKPQTFSCPNCKSIFDITENFALVFKGTFKGDFYKNYANLGELILYKKKEYHIVGISTKKEKNGHEKWNAYIVADANADLFFLSHGSDFYSYLYEIEYHIIANDVNASVPIKLSNAKYSYAFESYAETFCASGLFFNDIFSDVRAMTFEEENEGYNFISVEQYPAKTEAFFGTYLDKGSFKELFASQREINYIKSNASKNIVLLFALLSVAIGILHFVLNNNHTSSTSYTSMLTKEPNQYEFVKSGSYSVDKDDQKVTVEFISETQNGNTSLNVGLVNEKTNETHIIQGVKHFYNSKNFASSNKVQFCGINKGTYHLVFSSNLSDQTQNNIDIDYRLTVGGTSLTWLYVTLALLVVTMLLYNYGMLEKADFKLMQNFPDFIKFKKYQPLKMAAVILVGYCVGNYFFVWNKNCANSINTSQLEDASYTGTRSHFIHRTYSSGSHK